MKENEQTELELRRKRLLAKEFLKVARPGFQYEVLQPIVARETEESLRELRNSTTHITCDVGTTLKCAPTHEEAARYAVRYFNLWATADQWVVRKIASVEVIDRESSHSRFSYDIDFGYVREILGPQSDDSCHHFSLSKKLWLPLEQVAIHEYFGVDIESPWNRQCSLASNKESLHIAVLIVIGCVLVDAEIKDLKKDKQWDDLMALSQELLSRDSSLAELFKCTLSLRLADGQMPEADAVDGELPGHDCILNRLQTASPEAWALLKSFCTNDAMILVVPNDEKVNRGTLTVVVEAAIPQFYSSEVEPWRKILSRIGGPLVTRWVLLPGPFSDYGSWRIRVKFPSLTRVRFVRWLDEPIDWRNSSGPTWTWMKRSNEVQLHGTRPAGKHSSLEIVATTSRGYFAAPAFATLLLLFFLSTFLVRAVCGEGAGTLTASIATCTTVSEVGEGTDALTAVLVSIPTLAGVVLLVRNEHKTVASSLGFSRLLLALGVAAPLVVVGISALYEGGTVLGWAAWLNVMLQALLCIFFFGAVIAPRIWEVDSAPGQVERQFIGRYDKWVALGTYMGLFACALWLFTWFELLE